MKTQNKNYELPAAEHDVLEDLNKINETLEAIDEDISAVETAASHLLTNVNDIVNLGVHTDQLQNTTVDDIAANGYLVVSSDGSKLQTIEGGGDAGGNKHEVLVKKSDKNYDTEWKNLFKVGKELKPVSVAGNSNINSNNSVILSEDVVDCTSNVAFSNNQIKTDYELELNNSYILTNNAENVSQIESKKATSQNLGVVKIGSGIDVENGSISVFGGGDATKSEFGTVQPGAGFSLDDGALSFDGYSLASPTNAGILKVGSDFTVNENGELEMIVSGDPVVYNLGKIKPIEGSTISIERDIGTYRKSIDADTDFTIVLNNWTQTKDMAFYVEIVASGMYKITFNGGDEILTLRGTNLYKVSKPLGGNQVTVELIKAVGQSEELLTPSGVLGINEDFYIYDRCGATTAPNEGLYRSSGNALTFIPTVNPWVIYINFASPVMVSKLWFKANAVDAEKPVELLGSNDNSNWQTLVSTAGNITDFDFPVSNLAFYKYFKITFYTGRSMIGYALKGFRFPTQTARFTRVSPPMNSLSENGVTLSCVNADAKITNITNGAGIGIYDETVGYNWVQYYFEDAVIANIFYVSGGGTWTDWIYANHSYKLIASNDGQTWTELFSVESERGRLTESNTVRIWEFQNTTAYKYYKIVFNTNSNVLSVNRFILYRREDVE